MNSTYLLIGNELQSNRQVILSEKPNIKQLRTELNKSQDIVNARVVRVKEVNVKW